MKKIWSKLPIFYKLFSSILLFVLIGQFTMMVYIWGNEAKILLEKEKENLTLELSMEAKKLKNHLSNMAKETRFLASLEVMDDIIAKDIDKRISTILKRRADDLGKNIVFLAMDNNAFIASSKNNFIGKSLKNMQQNLDDEFLYFSAPIHASFDKKKYIGTLVMLYPLKNLASLKIHNMDKKLWLTTTRILKMFPHFEPQEHIIVAQKLEGILKGWVLHLSYKKSQALKTLKHIETLLLFTFLFSIFMLGIVVWFISKKLTNPIDALLKTSDEIIKTQDYSKQVTVHSHDEIGQLATSFNALIHNTDNLLGQLEQQNKIHQKKLLELISFFNAIIKTKDTKETIETALHRIQTFTESTTGAYVKNSLNTNAQVPITMYDYKSKEIKEMGFLVFDGAKEKQFDASFFMPLSKMIKLQLEHISLINDTQEALEAKSTFLSIISHELRTPLGSILNLTQHLMISPHLNEEESAMLRRIEISAEHLLSMINNILQLAKIESNSIQAHREKLDLKVILEEVCEMIEPLIEEKNLFFHKQITDKETLITSDSNLLKQIIINLLSNAIKFTQKGGIALDVCVENGLFTLTITDTGIGIDAKKQAQLFSPFYQIVTNIQNLKNSSGLGLALSQKVAALIDGVIMIESEGIGKGTQVTFTFKSV